MILLDEHLTLVHDEDQEPSQGIRDSLCKCNMTCAYAGESVLYRFNDKGDLFIAFLSSPKFHSIHIRHWELQLFKRERRLATDKFVVRDVGCANSKVYLDDCSFTVPTELLLR